MVMIRIFTVFIGLVLTAVTTSSFSDSEAGDVKVSYVDAYRLVPEFHFVSKGVFRSARPSQPGAIDALATAGIRTIINLQGPDGEIFGIGGFVQKHFEPGEGDVEIEAERQAATQNKIHKMFFFNVPVVSIIGSYIDDVEAVGIRNALRIMHDPKYQPVVAHCEHGHDRTGMLIALYRVLYEGKTIAEAYQEMVDMGHSGIVDHIITDPVGEFFLEEGCRIRKEKIAAGILKSSELDPECIWLDELANTTYPNPL